MSNTPLPHDHGQAVERILERVPSSAQFQLVADIFKQLGDGSRIRIFHLDEYIGLPADHPAGFRNYLWKRFVSKLPVPPAAFYPANPADIYSAGTKSVSESMPLVPVQLYESLCNLVIGILLIWLLRKLKCPGRVGVVYLVAYAVMRFSLEFLRGDHTDHIGIFTPSQAVALFLMLPAAALLYWYTGWRYRNAAGK